MKRIIGALLVVMTLGSTGTAFAFNGAREGFLMGFGIGASQYTIDYGKNSGSYYYYSGPTGKESTTGVETDLKIGYGFTDQFQMFYTNKVNFGSTDDRSGDSQLTVHGLTAIGANYYFSPTSPSFFLGGGVGLAAHRIIDTDSDSNGNDEDNNSGTGFYINGGFEFAKHWNVELSVVMDSIDYGGTYDGDRSALTYMITINGLAY